MNMLKMIFLLLFISVPILHLVLSNQFDPHVLPKNGPFFEGWYMRFVDFDTNDSLGVLFGHVLPEANNQTEDPKVLASILYRTNCTSINECVLTAANAVCDAKDLKVRVKNGPVVENPDDRSPSFFSWETTFGTFRQNGNITKLRFVFGKYAFRAVVGTPVPWGPDGEGPEGWINKLPFIPLHWFVFSLRSPIISYELTNSENGKLISGNNGVVHMEKNWGVSFPKGWVWSQGVTPMNVSFALSGGLVTLAHVTTTQFLFGYRNPAKNITLNFRPGNSFFSSSHDGCSGRFEITIKSLFLTRKVALSAFAKPKTFSDCLYGPEVTGFRPVCTESYDAAVKVTVYERSYLTWKTVDEQILKKSALEFGGEYTCKGKCNNLQNLTVKYFHS